MAKHTSTAETKQGDADAQEAARAADLEKIDTLIARCQSHMLASSSGILSAATQSATLSMYEELRREAEHDDGVRAQRVEWMQENVVRLEETIAKASQERSRFEADLSEAVEKKWIPRDDVSAWMATFDDPGVLEMYRSQWLKDTWRKTYVRGWKSLADARGKALKRAADAGLTEKDIPQMADLKSDERFLAKKYPGRRTLVDAVDALITSRSTGATETLRAVQPLLAREAAGPDRCLHPAKVGQWMKKIANDPARYTKDVLAEYVRGWREARAAYDTLAERFDAEGKPDGCAPLSLNAFLALPFDARTTLLEEGRNRLDAAKRMREGEATELEKAKKAVRQSIDLKDLDAAVAQLDVLQRDHQDDADIRSMRSHLSVLLTERTEDDDVREESAKTEEALTMLRAVPEGVPTAVAAHYEYLLESGDADQAAVFFLSMKVHADRVRSGRTSREEAYEATREAEEAEEATIVRDEEDDALLVTAGTPPSATIALLKEHGARGSVRSPGLVVEGMHVDQQLQLVAMNERMLAHMRHLDSVGRSYRAPRGREEEARILAA